MSADAERANLDQHHFEWEIFARHMAELRQRMEAAAPRDPRIESGIPPNDRLEEEAFVRLTGLTRPGNSEHAPSTKAKQDDQEPVPPTARPEVSVGMNHYPDDRISFSEPGVLDVDQQAEEEDAFDAQVDQVFRKHTPAPGAAPASPVIPDPNVIPEKAGIQNTEDATDAPASPVIPEQSGIQNTGENTANTPPKPPHSKSIAALRALVEDLEKDPPNPPDSGATPHTPKRPLPLNTTLEELEDLLQALEDQPRDGEE